MKNTNLVFRILPSMAAAPLYLLWRELLKHFKRPIDPNTVEARFVYFQVLIFNLVRKLRYCSFEEQGREPEVSERANGAKTIVSEPLPRYAGVLRLLLLKVYKLVYRMACMFHRTNYGCYWGKTKLMLIVYNTELNGG